jgi:hypothetical protein
VTPSGLLIDAISPYEYPTSAAWNFEGDLLKNLPAGGSPTIWNIPGVAHGGGESSYMVQAFTTGFLNKAASAKVTTERFVLNQITVNVAPVKIVNGRYVRQFAQDSTQTSPGTNRGVRHDSIDEWRNCAMIDNGSCAQRQSFPEGYRFGVKVRMQEKLTGWLHGRIYNPNVSITTSALNEQLIEVVASPIRVPVVGQWFKWSELTPAIQNYILSGKVQGGQGNQESKSLATGNYQEIVNTSGSEALEALALWLPQIKDRASATPSTWTFKSLEGFELATANSCIKDAKDLVGFVTTNAAAYSAGPPTFNSELQSLDYKVIAPHFTAKGEIFAGTYDLRIRGEVARCIYGFDKSPIRASISILSEDGSTQTATQTINEDNGWLSLSANGFTYSAPTIQVKLSQSTQAVVDTATVTSAATPTPVVKKTITCIKGKVKKVIRAVAPHCPKGFKAKR